MRLRIWSGACCRCGCSDRGDRIKLIGREKHDGQMTSVEDQLPELSVYEVDHLGIVVPDLAAAVQLYRDVLGCPVSEPVVPPDQGIAVVFVRFGNVRVELITSLNRLSPMCWKTTPSMRSWNVSRRVDCIIFVMRWTISRRSAVG